MATAPNWGSLLSGVHRRGLAQGALYGSPDRVVTEAVVTTWLVRQAGSAVPDLARSTVRLPARVEG